MKKVVLEGVPSTVLLPPNRSKWRYISGPHAIDVGYFEGESAPVLYDLAEDIHTFVDVGWITKKLFEEGKYPKLEEDQVFSIRSIIIDRNKNILTVIGSVLKSM